MEIQTIPGEGYECNSYLIKDDIWVLVDVGTDHRADSLYESISGQGGPNRVEKIVLTHTHYDHAGGSKRMSMLTGAEVLLHPVEGKLISSGDLAVTIDTLFGGNMKPFDWSPIDEGGIIATGSAEFRVMHIPGHSAGSIGLWENNSRSIIVGDVIFSDGGIGRYDLPSGNFDELCSSIERIAEMDVRNLYPGHGRTVIDDGADHVTMSLEMIRSLSQ